MALQGNSAAQRPKSSAWDFQSQATLGPYRRGSRPSHTGDDQAISLSRWVTRR